MRERRILVLGATGILGRPVTRQLADGGNRVRVLTRRPEDARRAFGPIVEIVAGSAVDRGAIEAALDHCDAVHVNLTQEAELAAMGHVIEAGRGRLERITYVSATTAAEENRWFPMVDVKMRTEAALKASGIASTIFCPTWVMEVLPNFIHGPRAFVIMGRRPPALHFLAARDFGRVVAASYEDERALGRRLFVHGPEAITLADALERFVRACHPELRVVRMQLWQARLLAAVARREALASVTRLLDYFDRVGELGDPAEANELLGAPTTTLDEWFSLPREEGGGAPH